MNTKPHSIQVVHVEMFGKKNVCLNNQTSTLSVFLLYNESVSAESRRSEGENEYIPLESRILLIYLPYLVHYKHFATSDLQGLPISWKLNGVPVETEEDMDK